MRTHKEHLYVRVGDGKRRAQIIHRPTLRQVAAKLRVCKRRIKNVLKNLKAGQPEPAIVSALMARRLQLESYLASL